MNTEPEMQRLIDVPDESFGRGMVLYVPDHAEDTAYCYMLVDMSAYGVGMALVEATGYHAGIIYVVLPSDCLTKGTGMVSKDWLIKNARYYLEDGTSLEEVYCMQYLPTPECPGATNTPVG